ncbi:unnamed protein product [Darwinula stevensoni]|uniref:Peptidase S1 domain-containing protein n=1 Tax=Darwinula stevensoni TaxID=69355 RepID=A0A7R8X4L0_9CRUS|nr:unnamed protein product [Darwinula stevensoni]CAG0879118.1 unnamed protein product [Darwinula stevensoni]
MAVKKVHPTAMLPLKRFLTYLAIIDSRLENFTFHILHEFTYLRELWLYNNFLTTVPAFKTRNPLSRLPSATIKSLKNLEKFYSSECNLGPILSIGVLEFRSKALKVVTLLGNNISKLDQGAITAQIALCTLKRENNKGVRPELFGRMSRSQALCLMTKLHGRHHGRNYICGRQKMSAIVGRKVARDRAERRFCGSRFWFETVTGHPGWASVPSRAGHGLDRIERLVERSGVDNSAPFNMDPSLSSLVAVFLKELLKEATQVAFNKKPMDFPASLDTDAKNIMNFRDQNSGYGRRMENGAAPPRFESQVSHIILHKDFNVYNNYDSDIALLKLTRPAVLTARVQLVCLPNRFDLSEAILDSGVPGWVAGWGHDGSDELAAVLTEVQLPVISNRKCVRDTLHFTGDPGVTRTLTSNMFCAGFSANTSLEDFRTVCPGDSGSPMVFLSNTSRDSHWTMEGIVSHFFQKGSCSMRRPGQYGIFTKVNRFTQWINRKIFIGF